MSDRAQRPGCFITFGFPLVLIAASIGFLA